MCSLEYEVFVFHHDYALIHFFSFSFQSVWCAWQLWCLFLNPEICVIPLGRAGAVPLNHTFFCYSLLELLLSKKGHNRRVFFIFLFMRTGDSPSESMFVTSSINLIPSSSIWINSHFVLELLLMYC